MKTYGPTGQYGAFNGSFQKPNSFTNSEDYLAFIRANLAHLRLNANQAHLDHGRGIVLLEHSDGPLVKAWFVTCDAKDLKAMTPEARRDYAEYDLETEYLIGVMKPKETPFQFWRMPEKRAFSNQAKKPGRLVGK